MLNAVYKKGDTAFSLEMTGHAQEQPGEICAAASMIVQTLAYAAEQWDAGVITDSEVRLTPGDCAVHIEFVSDARSAIEIQWDGILCGLQLLAINFPENVAFAVV